MEFNIDNYISNLAYINKDFNSTWEEILETVPKLTSKWVPGEANESDPLVVLLKELGIVTDKLNYNIDKNVLETFPDLLTQLRAAYSVFNSMGYVPEWYRSATLNITLIYNGGATGGDEEATSSSALNSYKQKFTLPKFTQICDADTNIIYTTLEDCTFTLGKVSRQSVLAIEGTYNDLEVNGSTLIDVSYLDDQNRIYFVQPNVAQNGIFISSDADFSTFQIEDSKDYSPEDLESESGLWRRVTNLYQQLPGSKVFKFGIDPSTGSNYIQFPEDVGNLIQGGIYIRYILSAGESGNIKKGTLSAFVNNPSIGIDITANDTTTTYTVTQDNFIISNTLASQNGKDPETIEEMQHNYEKVVGTFNTLVTVRDYENYLYNAETSLGQNYVSNIRVGDRTNDLYDSYKVKSLTTAYKVETSTKSGKAADADTLTAYDLRLYPLKSVSSVVDKSTFETTFESISKDTQDYTDINTALGEAKTILHDFKDPGTPIFIDYDLSGQVYLQKTLPEEEAKEVRDNIIQAIYETVNSRQLEFGQKVDYTNLIDVIKNADPRVQYVALNPIKYSLSEDSLEDFNIRTTLDIRKRSVLAGVTPWTTYKNLAYYWGASYDSNVRRDINSISPVVSSMPLESMKEGAEKDSYTVKANETLSILVPEYIDKTSYTNYFYMWWAADAERDTIKADTPYTLTENDIIYICDERPATRPSSSDSYRVRLGKGTVIRSNVSITSDASGKYHFNEAINMSTKVTLSVVARDESKIESTYSNTSDHTKGIKIATNSEGLAKALFTEDKIEYTLNIGEYLLWTNNIEPVLEVGIIGEGNTICKSAGQVGQKDATTGILQQLATIQSYDDLNEVTFAEVGNDGLSYKANTIYSFGEGYTVSGLKFANEYLSTEVFKLSSSSISYTNGSEEGTLPGILEGDSYLGSLCLALTVTPTTTQYLSENQQLVLGIKNSEFVTIEGTTGTDKKYTGKYIQSNSVIAYAGGPALKLSEEETKQLVIQSFTAGSLSKLEGFNASGADWKVPGAADDLSIFPVIFDNKQNEVKFVLAKGGTSLKDVKSGNTVIKQVGPIKMVETDKTYWNGSKQVEVGGILTGANKYKILDSTEIYLDGCYPTYTPSDSDLIEDPTDPDSFFKANHVLNRYVLPRLRSTEDLQISKLSIKE